METIKKKIINPKFTHKNYYLLGKRKDGKAVYLEQGQWDCDWYWGFGYLEVLNRPHTDINEHYHFDSLLNNDFGIEGILKHFSHFVLPEEEIWQLAGLMSMYYKLRKSAEIYCHNSHYTENDGIDITNPEMEKKINSDIEKIINQVHKLLTP